MEQQLPDCIWQDQELSTKPTCIDLSRAKPSTHFVSDCAWQLHGMCASTAWQDREKETGY